MRPARGVSSKTAPQAFRAAEAPFRRWPPEHLVAQPIVDTRLHIAQSADGTLTAWLDRVLALDDQRHGELLEIVSSRPSTIVLQTTGPGSGQTFKYRTTLSVDGNTLTGRWGDPGAGRLNASESFRRKQ
jgi:hypothetical protein